MDNARLTEEFTHFLEEKKIEMYSILKEDATKDMCILLDKIKLTLIQLLSYDACQSVPEELPAIPTAGQPACRATVGKEQSNQQPESIEIIEIFSDDEDDDCCSSGECEECLHEKILEEEKLKEQSTTELQSEDTSETDIVILKEIQPKPKRRRSNSVDTSCRTVSRSGPRFPADPWFANVSSKCQTDGEGENGNTRDRIKTISVCCFFCALMCPSETARDEHVKEDHGPKPYNCWLTKSGCVEKFETSHSLKRHISKEHSDQEMWFCQAEGCQESFKAFQLLDRHVWQMHEEGLFRCTKEGCSFESSTRYPAYHGLGHAVSLVGKETVAKKKREFKNDKQTCKRQRIYSN